MSTEQIIKSQAREKLKNSGWSKALIGLAVILIMYMIIESIATIETIILDTFSLTEKAQFITKVLCGSAVTASVFLLSPIVLGYLKMLCTDDKDYNMNDVVYYFSSFKRYSKAIAFIFSFVFRMIIPTILCFSLVIALFVIKNFWLKEAFDNTIYNLTLILFVITSILWTLRYSLKYFISFYLMCCDENKAISYYFNTSKAVMREHNVDVVRLFNRFWGWIILCITVLPLIYVLPYFTQTMCISAKWLSQLSRNE